MGNNISFSGGYYGKKKNCSYVLVVGFIIGGAIGGYAMIHQPHMVAALDRLKEAKAQLEVAEHNKGGHRAEAIKLTNAAIEEVKRGIEAGERE